MGADMACFYSRRGHVTLASELLGTSRSHFSHFFPVNYEKTAEDGHFAFFLHLSYL